MMHQTETERLFSEMKWELKKEIEEKIDKREKKIIDLLERILRITEGTHPILKHYCKCHEKTYTNAICPLHG